MCHVFLLNAKYMNVFECSHVLKLGLFLSDYWYSNVTNLRVALLYYNIMWVKTFEALVLIKVIHSKAFNAF